MIDSKLLRSINNHFFIVFILQNKLDFHRLQQYSHLELIAKQVVEGFITGLHKSPFHGFSVEFAEHRLYNSGESTRHIDWKLFARSEKLFVKRYEEETNLRCQIIIDNSSSMYFPDFKSLSLADINKLGFSVYSAAALMELLRRQRDAVGLSVFSDNLSVHTTSKSNSVHFKSLYTELENLLNDQDSVIKKTTSAVKALHQIAESIHKRSLIVLFTDMMDTSVDMDEVFAALQHLKYNKHEVILFHVLDKKTEMDFDLDNRPYNFIDLESGIEIKAHPNEIKEHYTTAMDNFQKELKLRCGQYKIDYVQTDVSKGFNEVLLPYLIKRSKML